MGFDIGETRTILESVLADVDVPILEYLAGIVVSEHFSSVGELYGVFGESLVSFGAAFDSDEALEKTKQVFKSIEVRGWLESKESAEFRLVNEAQRDRFTKGTEVFLRTPQDDQWVNAVVEDVVPGGLCVVINGMERIVTLGQVRLKELEKSIIVDRDSNMKQVDSLVDLIVDRPDTSQGDEAFFEAKESARTERKRKKEEIRVLAREKYLEHLEAVSEEKRQIDTLRTYLASVGKGNERCDISVPDFSMSIIGGGENLLEGASLRLVSGRRYGLIGRNGIGKTTLLSMMAHYEIKGFPTFLRVIHVQQEVRGDDRTVLQTVLDADIERTLLLREEAQIQKSLGIEPVSALSKDFDSEGMPSEGEPSVESERLEEIYARLREIEAWEADARASAVLTGLQVSPEMMLMKTKNLSGGWRMRVSLACGLFVEPDVLLLDEPTNHLDFPAVLWLERYLTRYEKTLVLVSHDRQFVNNVITDVVHFDQRKLVYYRGDYDTFEKVRSELRRQQAQRHEAQSDKREHIQSFIDRFRYNAKRASLVQSRIKALARMENIEQVIDDPLFRFEFPEIDPLEKPLVRVTDLTFGYDAKKVLLNRVGVMVYQDSRIGIIGGNGVGKSTLIKLIVGQLNALKGVVHLNQNMRVALFAQHHVDQLDLRLSPIEQMRVRFEDVPIQSIRAHLGRYGVSGGLGKQKMSTLSGGQKSRVAFALVTWSRPHLIIMDEPTNHLDLETVDALIVAINTYAGAVIMVSHDLHMLSCCAGEFWAVADCRLRVFKTFQEARVFCYKDIDDRHRKR